MVVTLHKIYYHYHYYYFNLLFQLRAEELLHCGVLNYETGQSNRLSFWRRLLPRRYRIVSKFLRKAGKHLSSNAMSSEDDRNLGRYRSEGHKSEPRMNKDDLIENLCLLIHPSAMHARPITVISFSDLDFQQSMLVGTLSSYYIFFSGLSHSLRNILCSSSFTDVRASMHVIRVKSSKVLHVAIEEFSYYLMTQ
jgi:hypothetical protein